VQLEEAQRRRDNIQTITETANSNDNRFFKLIRKEKQGKAEVTKEIVVDGKLLPTTDEVCRGWADHFGDLATPKDTTDFDKAYKEEVICDLTVIQELVNMERDNPEPITVVEVQKAINSLNTKKASDVDGITAGHLKNDGILLTAALTQLINIIMNQKQVPSRLKLGLLTLIWKKGTNLSLPTTGGLR
jgi:seryl-tRNA synthetase